MSARTFARLVALLAIYVAPAWQGGWLLDDGRALATHLNDGHPWGEWTHATYEWSAGDGGHIWRPLPAFAQHLAAMLLGRTPAVFRLLNALLLGLVVLTAMRAARRWGASDLAAALVGGALVLHPVVPEVVGWSSDVYDVALALVLAGALLRVRAEVGLLQRGAEAFCFGLAACLCKESALLAPPAFAAAGWAASGARGGLVSGASAAGAVLVFLGLHGVVTGDSYGGAASQPLAHLLLAGLDALGSLPTLPARATAVHLFDPSSMEAAPLGLGVLAGLLGVTAAIPSGTGRLQWLARWWASPCSSRRRPWASRCSACRPAATSSCRSPGW